MQKRCKIPGKTLRGYHPREPRERAAKVIRNRDQVPVEMGRLGTSAEAVVEAKAEGAIEGAQRADFLLLVTWWVLLWLLALPRS